MTRRIGGRRVPARSGRKGDRMTIAEQMLDTYPRDFNVDKTLLARCIEACYQCDEACTACADDCLSEQGQVESLVKCIRLNLDCADICAATARVSRVIRRLPGPQQRVRAASVIGLGVPGPGQI